MTVGAYGASSLLFLFFVTPRSAWSFRGTRFIDRVAGKRAGRMAYPLRDWNPRRQGNPKLVRPVRRRTPYAGSDLLGS